MFIIVTTRTIPKRFWAASAVHLAGFSNEWQDHMRQMQYLSTQYPVRQASAVSNGADGTMGNTQSPRNTVLITLE